MQSTSSLPSAAPGRPYPTATCCGGCVSNRPAPSAFNIYWAGWNATSADPTSAVAIHHPTTDEKRISFENDPTSTTSYLGTTVPGDGTHIRITDWDLGTTEPGSSGSPLFDQNKLVVGQLHGGYAACGNNDSDWYGRFSRSWTGGGTSASRLSNWLDPGNTGVTTLTGRDAVGGRDGRRRTGSRRGDRGFETETVGDLRSIALHLS